MNYKHKKFIESKLRHQIEQKGALSVGDNLNDYLTFDDAEFYVNEIKKTGECQVGRSNKYALMGKVVEETLAFLLSSYFF